MATTTRSKRSTDSDLLVVLGEGGRTPLVRHRRRFGTGGRIGVVIVDLTLPLDIHTPLFPGYPGFESRQLESYEADGKVSHHVSMNTHIGTHVDAPSHFIDGGATVDRIEPGRMMGEATVFDLRDRSGGDIEPQDLGDAAPRSIGDDIVVLVTGDVDRHLHRGRFFEEAAVLTSDAATWLVDHDVRVIANDFLTEAITDPNRPVHHILLGSGIPIVEYLCNTDEIAHNATVDFYCLPLQLRGLEAAPARVVAGTT